VARPKEVVISAFAVREGLLYSLLDAAERARTRCSRRQRS